MQKQILQQNTQSQEPYQLDCNTQGIQKLPISAPLGLQYTALASIASTDSVLRDLPSISVSFNSFKLIQSHDYVVNEIMSIEDPSLDNCNLQYEYLKSIISNASVDNICFQSATQITEGKDTFEPYSDNPISTLGEFILKHCTQPSYDNFDIGIVYQLPTIDPGETLHQFRNEMSNQHTRNFYSDTSFAAVIQPDEASSSTSSMSNPSKRMTMDYSDTENEISERLTKKARLTDFQAVDNVNINMRIEVIIPVRDIRSNSSVYKQPVPSPSQKILYEQSEDDFDDLINNILGKVTDTADNLETTSLSLTSFDLRQLERIIYRISSLKLVDQIQADTVPSILKYLESSMGRFVSFFQSQLSDVKYFSHGTDGSYDINTALDQVSSSLDHISLSLTIFNVIESQSHLFPEELLADTLDVFKQYLDVFLAPVLGYSTKTTVSTNRDTVFSAIVTGKETGSRVVSLVVKTCEICSCLGETCHSELSDLFIVKLVYTALSLFFIDIFPESTLAYSEFESVRQAGSSLLRKVYDEHPSQRKWILEEILSMVIKLPHGKKVTKSYRLIDGIKIHSTSALLMQLVQTGSEGAFSISLSPGFKESKTLEQQVELQKILGIFRSAHEDTSKSAAYVLNFLLMRCTKGTKSSLEVDYRTVFDSLITDLLVSLGQPEWPCAELFVLLLSKAMVQYLDDPKSDPGTKILAIDTLGLISVRIRTVMNLVSKGVPGDVSSEQAFYKAIDSSVNLSTLHYLQGCSRRVFDYLKYNESNDMSMKMAKNTWVCQWIHSICVAGTKENINAWNEDCWRSMMDDIYCYLGSDGNLNARQTSLDMPTRTQVSFDALCLTVRQQLFSLFDMLLSRILIELEAPTISLRAKSLKALSVIVAGDYAVLIQQNVRKTIALRIQDQSPSVRDAATDLIGKYMLQDPSVRSAYYEIVSDRISDVGLNVRKRVIRLLRDIYQKVDSMEIRVDIAQKLLLRAHDDETTVKDLAVKCVTDVLLGPVIESINSVSEGYEGDHDTNPIKIPPSRKREVSQHARFIIEIAAKLTAHDIDAFKSVILYLLKKERSMHDQEFTKIFTTLVDCLVDLVQTLQDEEASKLMVASAVQTLHVFVEAEPKLIEAKHIGSLLVYLHCPSTSDDWRITMFVLRIFQCSIPVIQGMTANDSEMAEKLVSALVAKCPVILLPEATSVLCLAVNVLTGQSARLCKFFQTCIDLLTADMQRIQNRERIQENKTRRLMNIVALISRHFPFEQAFKRNSNQSHLEELKSKMTPTIEEYVFNIFVSAFESGYSRSLQLSALQGIGHIFITFPVLMNSQRSSGIMDSIFDGEDNEMKSELLQIFNTFLSKIQAAPFTGQGNEQTYSLIVKAEDHIDAGIGGAILQRYLDRILQCAFVLDKQLQDVSVEVITQVTYQALAHPMLCMPAIIALETSDDPLISRKMLKIHKDLHQKHSSLIYARAMECFKSMYAYQTSIQRPQSDTKGYKMEGNTGSISSLLSPMYSLIGDKRQARNALLSSLVKLLDIDIIAPVPEVDGFLLRFTAEALAYLDYRTMEEVLLVIFLLNRIIASSGATVLQCINDEVSTMDSSNKGQLLPKRDLRRGYRLDAKGKAGSSANYKKSNGLRATDSGDKSSENSSPTKQSRINEQAGSILGARDRSEYAFPKDIQAKVSLAVEISVELKNYLWRVYDISEVKYQQFQPTAHTSHKEKPVLKFFGTLHKIQWKFDSSEIEAICNGLNAEHYQSSTQSIIDKQLTRFQQIMEAETVEQWHSKNIANLDLLDMQGQKTSGRVSGSIKDGANKKDDDEVDEVDEVSEEEGTEDEL